VGRVDLKQEVEDIPEYGHITSVTQIHVYVCPACEEATVWSLVWSLDIQDEFAHRRLYPTARDRSALPERVRTRLDAALKVKKIEPGFYAVGIRRMLETVCNIEGAAGGDLFAKLDDLAAHGRIPGTLAEAAHELRKVGNLGAHDSEVDVAPEDVPAIEALAEAILEYLYRAPAQLATVRSALASRSTSVKAESP